MPEVVRPEEETIPIEVRKEYQEALDRALAGLPDGVRATGELPYGLGTASSVLLRQASVPVPAAPRGGGWP